MWVPITDRRESRRAFDTLRRRFIRGARKYAKHRVGWQGGQRLCDAYWRPSLGIWGIFTHAPDGAKRYWCAFGTCDPDATQILSIDVEINPPLEGFDRRLAGAFLRDQQGKIYLAHSGRIGGGAPGIGKSKFVEFYRVGNWQPVTWPDRKSSMMVVLGSTNGERLPAILAGYSREVAKFKHESRYGREVELSNVVPPLTFTPEATGKRNYDLNGYIEANCAHGIVVSALAEALKKRSLGFANDCYRDLIVTAENGFVTHLFEIRTDVDTTSLYTGVGQLMLHGAAIERKTPKLILVVPSEPPAERSSLLRRLGISLLVYNWSEDEPIFSQLDAVL